MKRVVEMYPEWKTKKVSPERHADTHKTWFQKQDYNQKPGRAEYLHQ
jgi:hypothetical protein